jgi:hypothetical protein
MPRLSTHVRHLTVIALDRLAGMPHRDGAPLTVVYGPVDAADRGGTIAFNVLDRSGKPIKALVYTHSHPDHSSGARGLLDPSGGWLATGCPAVGAVPPLGGETGVVKSKLRDVFMGAEAVSAVGATLLRRFPPMWGALSRSPRSGDRAVRTTLHLSADGLDPAGKAIRFIGSDNRWLRPIGAECRRNRWSKEANTDSDAETNRGTGQSACRTMIK